MNTMMMEVMMMMMIVIKIIVCMIMMMMTMMIGVTQDNLNDCFHFRYVGTVGEKSQLQGKKMIKDLTKKMFLLESSDGGSSAGW